MISSYKIPVRLTATLLAQFTNCEREGYLFFYGITTEHTSETVKIGKYFHEMEEKGENTEVELDGIKIDKFTEEYVEEYKKSSHAIASARIQLLFYLFKLREKGVLKKGLIRFHDSSEKVYVELDELGEKELSDTIERVVSVVNSQKIPDKLKGKTGRPHKKCQGCSYYEFCWT